jgi:hypothetical protein
MKKSKPGDVSGVSHAHATPVQTSQRAPFPKGVPITSIPSSASLLRMQHTTTPRKDPSGTESIEYYTKIVPPGLAGSTFFRNMLRAANSKSALVWRAMATTATTATKNSASSSVVVRSLATTKSPGANPLEVILNQCARRHLCDENGFRRPGVHWVFSIAVTPDDVSQVRVVEHYIGARTITSMGNPRKGDVCPWRKTSRLFRSLINPFLVSHCLLIPPVAVP